jgi:hypothetical protein
MNLEKKSREFAKKIGCICRDQGIVFSSDKSFVHKYSSNIQGIELNMEQGLKGEKAYSKILVKEGQEICFDYFLPDVSKEVGLVKYFNKGRWEEVVNENYLLNYFD